MEKDYDRLRLINHQFFVECEIQRASLATRVLRDSHLLQLVDSKS